MKVFVAGATGAIGTQLLPRLVGKGHDVVGMTRSESKQDQVRALGATPVVADALDPGRVAELLATVEPDVIVHQLTAISTPDPRHFVRDFALTNRLRTEATDHMLSAGRAVGIQRFVVQSYCAWPYARVGGPVKSEGDPLDPTPAREMRESLAAIRHLEAAARVVTAAGWLGALRRRRARGRDLSRRSCGRRSRAPGPGAVRARAGAWRRARREHAGRGSC